MHLLFIIQYSQNVVEYVFSYGRLDYSVICYEHLQSYILQQEIITN